MSLDHCIVPREDTTCQSILSCLLDPSGVIHHLSQSQALVSRDLIGTVPKVQMRQPVPTLHEPQTLQELLSVHARSAAVLF